MKKLAGLLVMAVFAASSVSVNAQSVESILNGASFSSGLSSESQQMISKALSHVNTEVRFQDSYTRSNGTFVESHYKTMPNSTNWDNFSTRENVNPYTGGVGSVARDYSSRAYNYGSGSTIYTGPRGGQYYINGNGNKTYVPKRGW